mgnify:CR=1 FL=1
MKLVILPGNNKSNKEWADAAAEAFASSFSDIYVQSYSHWDTDEEFINFDTELEKLIKNVGSDDCIVVAKSAGSMLSIYGVHKNKFHPKKCVFVGLPVRFAEENNFELAQWIQSYDIPTIVIQNSHDPVTSFEELKTAFDHLNKTSIELIEINGNDHKYSDFKLIKEKIGDFFTGTK